MVPPKRTLSLTARCDQTAKVRLVVTVTSVHVLAHGAKRRVTRFRVSAPAAIARSGVPLRLTVRLPRAALATGARDSVAAVLTAVNANGMSTATAKIARLILV